MHPKLCRAEWLALGFALLVAAGCLVHQWWYPSSLYDAAQYAEMGRNIVEHGPLSRFMESQVRTYGYPAFLSLVYVIAGALHLPSVLVLFLVQLGLYLAAAALLRRSVAHYSLSVSRVVFCGLLLNYYALVYTPECLTESLSLSALILLGAGWLEAYRRQGLLWLLTVLSLLAGFSVMIRPANMFMAATWLAGTGLIGFRCRFGARRAFAALAIVVVCVALPFLPQLAYNGLQFGRWTPLLARDLGQRQQAWGIHYIKYATAMPPSPEAAVPYLNPWLPGTVLDDEAPLKWYAANPGRGALTLAVHSFNLTDQDLLFTYSHNLDPWYRVPLGIINHAAVALGLIGLVIGSFTITHAGSRALKDAWALVLIILGAVWAMHVWTAVEMRFGMPLLCLLFPAALYTPLALARSGNVRTIAGTAVIVALYVAGALRLSAWVRDQSPLIHAVVSGRHNQGRDASDRDGDGVPDDLDSCPTVYAASPSGCPVSAPLSGDWRGSAEPQVVFVNKETGSAYVWTLNNGVYAGGGPLVNATNPGWKVVGTSDLTGDGKSDLLWQQEQTSAVQLFTMVDSAKVDEQPVGPPVGDRRWRIAATGDFDGDGQADIVWQHIHTGNVAIWFMTSAHNWALFKAAAYVTSDGDASTLGTSPWRVAGTLDFDGDGHRDLVGENSATGEIKIWRLGAPNQHGVPIVREISLGTVTPDWQLRAVANYTGNDKDDLLFQTGSTGQLHLWVRAGDGFISREVPNSPSAVWEASGPR